MGHRIIPEPVPRGRIARTELTFRSALDPRVFVQHTSHRMLRKPRNAPMSRTGPYPPGLVFKRAGDATEETCPRSPHLPPFSSWPFDCLARAIGPGRIGALTRRPEGPSVFNGNKWPPLWASGCLGNRKPGPMAQAMSMAGPLARNHMSRLGKILHSVACRA